MDFVELSNGNKLYYNDSNDPVINALKQGVLFGRQNYLQCISLLKAIPKRGAIVDVGAHIGTFSVLGSAGYQEHILIEADDSNFDCLQNSFGDQENMKLIKSLVSNKKGRADFSERRGPFGWIIENENGKYETDTLDNLLEGSEVAFLKIDIEGGEIQALEGAKKVLEQKPLMMVEVNGYCLMQKGYISNDLLGKIDELDYDVFINLNGMMLKISKDVFFPFCVADVLCIPKGEYTGSHTLMTEQISLDIHKQIKNSFNEDCDSYFNWLKRMDIVAKHKIETLSSGCKND